MPSNINKWLLLVTAALVFLVGWTRGSEFPERECCDPVYPPPIPTVPSSSVATPTGRSGPNIKTAIAILNCLLARQLCFEDASCSAILEIIPRVCGPELVACSTVTVTKCQAALRTLQAFPFFKPTCLCREPHVDPECNSFRDFLFDHPCVLVLKKEKDPYPVDALPTCNHALSVCQQERKCIKLFDDFKTHCKVRDNKCRMDDRELCHESWTNLRLSPMFGCICPNNHMKRRCDRIFSMVNHNPCVDILPFSFDLSGTDSALYPYDPEQGYFKNFWFPTTNLYPYFLFPPTASRPHHRLPAPHGTVSHHVGTITLRTHAATDHSTSQIDASANDNRAIGTIHKGNWANNSFHKYQAGFNAITGITAHAVLPTSSAFDLYPFKVISTSDNGSSFDYGLDMGTESQVQNPLVDTESEDFHATILRDHISVTMLKNRVTHRQVFNISQYDEDIDVVRPHQHSHRKVYPSNYDVRSENNELSKVVFQSTCHLALENCNNNYTCRMELHPILHYCDQNRCNRNSCMEALQTFYRKPDHSWSLEVAFCLCKKTENKRDTCMIAQEKLHPVCAQRIEGNPTPTCHSLAKNCREDPECRSRLEYYEQSCAVDAVTKKCAGAPSECRTAMLGILGTELRTTCACKGTDFTQLYDCLGWQRLLWVNPCVVESQKDYHLKRQQFFTTPVPTTPTTTTTTTTRMTTTEMKTTTSTFTIGQMTYMAYTEASYQTKETNTEFVYIPPPTNMTTITTTMMTTTNAPKFCVFQRPQQSNQYIQEGKTKRMYHEDEVECSEICHCSIGESLTCNTICVDRKPCKTEFALYNHAAPAYQAFRGRCLCYSGRFICMKPLPGEYSLPQGIFLFLGYSETDETLLKPHSNLTVHDAVTSLQEFLLREADNGTLCTLSLFNVTRENIILVAKVAGHKEGPGVSPAAILEREKEECESLLETISEKINSQHSDFNSHLLLSIFKMAEVEIVEMETSAAHSNSIAGSSTLLLLLLIIQILLRPVCCSTSS